MKTQEKETHAFASPSNYKRWMTCSGSLNLEAALKNKGLISKWDEGSPAAKEGTRLHDVAERVLNGDILLCPDEVKDYVDYCRSVTPDNAEVFVEAKVPLFYSPKETGTVDYAVRYGDVLQIVDLKTGRIKVDAKNNLQMLIYAVGLITPVVQEIRMTIFQYDAPFTWTITKQDANALCHEIGAAAKLALDPSNTDLKQSTDACRWCRARPYCTEHTGSIVNMLGDTNRERMSDEQLVKLLSNKKEIVSLLNDIEKVLFERVSKGESVSGVTMTTGRKSAKQWKKDVDPITELVHLGVAREDAQKIIPITVTQALSLTNQLSEDLYEQLAGKPKIEAEDIGDVINQFESL